LAGYYPPNFGYGTGAASGNEEETVVPKKPVSSVFSGSCWADSHHWADTGTRWSYCKKCDAEGTFDVELGKFKKK